MITPSEKGHYHSADVQIQLRLEDIVIPVDQLGPDFFISRYVVDHPPAVGEMVLSIDGKVQRWTVNLFEGMSSRREETPTA
jgi:hypothetical protein